MKQPKDIKIGYAFIPDKETQLHYELVKRLSKEEQNVWRLFKNERQRLEFLYGRIVLRKTLADATGKNVSETRWNVSLDSYGRPVISDGKAHLPPISFSISHSDGLVCVAASERFHVGLDVELIPNKSIDISAALSPEEMSYLEGLEPSEKMENIIKIWTVKEAYSKLLGLGLFMDFQKITVYLGQERLSLLDQTMCKQINHVNILSQIIEVENRRYVLSLCYASLQLKERRLAPKEYHIHNVQKKIKNEEFFLL